MTEDTQIIISESRDDIYAYVSVDHHWLSSKYVSLTRRFIALKYVEAMIMSV